METKKTTKRPSQSLPDLIHQAELILVGIKANEAAVAKKGIDKAFITKFEEDLNDLKTKNAEQEKLKAATKLKTEEVNEKSAQVKKTFSEAKTLVKVAIPQGQWLEFGIEDKR